MNGRNSHPHHYHKMDPDNDPVIDKGLLTLINQKLENGTSFLEIRSMLERAGISKIQMERALLYTAKYNQEEKHKNIEENDFLPPLSGIKRIPINRAHNSRVDGIRNIPSKKPRAEIVEEPKEQYIEKVLDSEIRHRGLFSGRLRRQEFIIGLLFFFGLGVIFFTTGVYILQTFLPEFWSKVSNLVTHDTKGFWLIAIPLIFAPITLMLLSLMTRRLHNIGLPGFFAWFFLLLVVPPFNQIAEMALPYVYGLLALLFLILIVKKGHNKPNRHGPLPRTEGSIFKKIFGNDIITI